MNQSLREVLRRSNVAAVAIAVLVFWWIDAFLTALWEPLWRAINFLITAVAILDIPFFSFSLTYGQALLWIGLSFNLLSASLSVSAAWALSHWVYGTGPLRSLRQCVTSLRRNSA